MTYRGGCLEIDTERDGCKNQNLKKMKKTPGDIIILHMCTKNYNQMMSSS